MRSGIKARFLSSLIIIVIMTVFLGAPGYAAAEKAIITLSASYSAGKVSVTGTTSQDVLAVAVMLYDTDGTTLLRMETFGVVEQSFAADIYIALPTGTYAVKAADYNGSLLTSAVFTHASSGNNDGSGSGSSSSGGSAPSAPLYTAMLKDGSNQAGSLSVTVDERHAAGTASLDDMKAKELFENSGTISMPSIPGVNTYKLELPAALMAGAESTGELTFSAGTADIVIPGNMLSTFPDAAGKKAGISIGQASKEKLTDNERAAVGNRPLIELKLTLNGEITSWNNPNAPVTVSIPYTPAADELRNPESIVIWYLDGSGKPVCITNGCYDPASGHVTFSTTHFSIYAVGYNQLAFNDVVSDKWYSRAVSFIAAREITSGTGGGNFSPEKQLTRGEFIVLLMRAYGLAPDTNPSDNFADAGRKYYTGYLAAAKRLNISAGTGNNMFAPDRDITRQEMFTLLYNALKAMGKLPIPSANNSKSLSGFSDADDMKPWAKEAMTLLVKTETISGSNGRLNPAGTTTRAEFAQVLYNLLWD